jgi:lipopolysaccharide transport system permease protein
VTSTSPAARFRWVFAYRTLLKYLVLREIKTKSRGTYLGIGWTLMNPLFTIVVYYIIFQHVFRVTIPDFLGFFLLGFLMWTFFSRSIMSAATCILENESMVKRALFPLEILPLTKVLYHLFNHVLAIGIALPLLIALWGGKVSWHLFWVAGVLVALAVFTLASTLWIATAGVFFRDTRDILDVALPILFWATPVFYSPEMAPPFLQVVIWANPLTPFIGVVRTAVLDGHAPSAAQLGLMALWMAIALGSSVLVFIRYQPRFAEEL